MKSHIDVMSEQRYIPEDAEELRFDDLDMVIYLYTNSANKPTAICYEGRRKKASFHYWYHNDERRQEKIDRWVDSRKIEIEFKQSILQERKNFKTSLTVGSVLSSSWGYDQTNVDFYQVLEVRPPKRVVLQEINKRLVDTHGNMAMSGKVVPLVDNFSSDKKIVKNVNPGEQIKLSSFQRATLWDGQPQYCSWYA